MRPPAAPLLSVDDLIGQLAERSYLADRSLAMVLTVALALRRPLLLEGEAGVGKTEVAKTLADVLGARLIRLQCYEGIDVSHALYDWNYAKQMLHIRTLEAAHAADRRATAELFDREFLVRRPLLEAIEHEDDVPPVLLIDEIDRADDEFEAFLLELLSDFQVTIPELGTIRARTPPWVILTSNRTRELHDALRRRCLYYWIDHPTLEQEVAIVRARLPGVSERLARQAAAFVASMRELDLVKAPGVAETLDWVEAVAMLGEQDLQAELTEMTLTALVKYREDIERVTERGVAELVEAARAAAAA
jgi:MoxR-like ATPase